MSIKEQKKLCIFQCTIIFMTVNNKCMKNDQEFILSTSTGKFIKLYKLNEFS